MTEKNVKIGAKKIFYSQKGKGEPIIILPGLGNDHNSLSKVISSFSPSFLERFRIIAPDLPPYGKRQNFDTLPFYLRRFLDRLKIKKTILVGYSLGGLVSLKFSSLFPKRVVKLVICSTPLSKTHRTRRGWRFLVKQASGQKIDRALDFLKKHPRIVRKLTHSLGIDTKKPLDRKILRQISLCFQDLFEYEWQKDIERISCPTLCIYGTRDIYLRYFGGTGLYPEIKNVKMVAVKGSHFLVGDQHIELSRLLAGFIND